MNLNYRYGLMRGLPIALGYVSVSFGFGISAVSAALAPWQAVLMSLINVTSAGQVAGVSVIAAGGAVLEMILTQFVINVRYALMAIALTQKLETRFPLVHRLLIAFGITDEVFVMAASEKNELTPAYLYGLITLPILGWTLGTALGAYAGQLLPQDICAALSLAIYTMFVAIIVPPAKNDRGVLYTVLLSVLLSCLLYYVPLLRAHISQGFSIILCAVIASALLAYFKPTAPEKEAQDDA